MARKLSIEAVMAMLEEEEGLDSMEVVTAGSDEDMDAQYLEECDSHYGFNGCKQK